MPTLPCPRCGQLRTAHAACPGCGAPGLETDIPPLKDLDVPEALPSRSPSIVPGPGPFAPSVDVVARPQRSDVLGRIGYLVAAVLSVGALVLFHGVVWGDHDEDRGVPVEEVAAPPDAPPDAPDAPPAPPDAPPAPPDGPADGSQEGMTDQERAEAAAEASRQAQLERVEQAAEREAEAAAERAEREAEAAAERAERAAARERQQ